MYYKTQESMFVTKLKEIGLCDTKKDEHYILRFAYANEKHAKSDKS